MPIILWIHSTDDRIIVLFWHGQKLYSVAQVLEKFYQVENIGYSGASVVDSEKYWQAIKSFV